MNCVGVVCVHRHGSRFPSKKIGMTNLPDQEEFWNKYGSVLISEGMRSL